MDAVDIDVFISEIKKIPEIWDTRIEEYYDKIKKE